MKRWRRPLILIALLLLAGAVVNVAVAWAIAARAPLLFPYASQTSDWPAWFVAPKWPPDETWWPRWWKRETRPFFGSGHATYFVAAAGPGGVDRTIHAETIAFGWPLRSMRSGFVRHGESVKGFGQRLPAPPFMMKMGAPFCPASRSTPSSTPRSSPRR